MTMALSKNFVGKKEGEMRAGGVRRDEDGGGRVG
jgi:hypothetical protein